MARVINFEGRKITVPDDATDDEVSSIISSTVPQNLTREQLISQIPAGANTAPTVQAEPSTYEKIAGAIETPFALAANAVTGIPTYLSGAFGPKTQQKVAQNINYQPRTQVAQNALETVGRGLEATKLPPFMPAIAGANMLAESIKPAAQSVIPALSQEASLIKGAVQPAIDRFNAPKLASKVAASYENAPKIEAAQQAERLGIMLNRDYSNPGKVNSLLSAISGRKNENDILSSVNANKWADIGKREMGIPKETKLTPNVYKTARDMLAGPNKEIAKIGVLSPDDAVLSKISSINTNALIGEEVSAAAVRTLVDDALVKISQGIDSADALKEISNLRKKAHDVYRSQSKGQHISEDIVAKADARITIANELENLIESNISNPKLLSQWRDNRAKMAKTYAYENATDFNTGKIDPATIAKITKKDNALTGDIRAIGEIAGNFPEVAAINRIKPTLVESAMNITRAGVPGTLGFVAGTAAGFNPFVGAAVGAAAGKVGSMVATKRVTSPSYQKSAIPKDYRPAVEPTLKPVEPGSSNVVPYDYGQSVISPEQVPNFVKGRPESVVTPAGDYAQPQLNSPSNPLEGVAQRRAFDYKMQKAIAEQEALAAESQAAAGRQTTGRGTLFDLDPITGKLREASAGVKGATPEIFMADTGKSLGGAASKLAEGRAFDMTAAEKASWNNTKIDFQSAIPELNKLTDKQIFSKMADRQWVQNAIDTINQKAKMFQELEARSQDRVAQSMARIQREKLMDSLEKLQEVLSSPRPISGSSQGPKTRAFNKGMLSGEQP